MAGLSKSSMSNYMKIEAGDVDITSRLSAFSGGAVSSTIDEWNEFNQLYSFKDVGTMSVEAYTLEYTFVAEDAAQKLLTAAAATREDIEFKITLYGGSDKSTGHVITFTGVVSDRSISSEINVHRSATYTITVKAGVTEAALA